MIEINLQATQSDNKYAKDMAAYIMSLLRDNAFTEKTRQYFTWGVRSLKYMVATDGLHYGLQMSVGGLKFKGRVRVWYNRASDYFDIEFVNLRGRVVEELEDIDCFQLHNILHQRIERTDDPEV